MIYKCTFLRSFGLTQKKQKLRSQFALRLLRLAGPFLLLFSALSFFISPSQILNSQSSIFNSQKAGVFLSFRAGFSAKDAGFFSFYAYLFKTNKRESISILTGFTFYSRLVCFIIMIDLLKNV